MVIFTKKILTLNGNFGNMSQLIIVRGLPGSGKSTFAKTYFYLRENRLHLEADMYHVNNNGVYVFETSKIRDSHEWCYNTTRIMLTHGKDVIVSNTFTQLWEMEKYINFCNNVTPKIDFKVYRMTKNYGNIHGVPQVTLDKMAARFEDYPGEILV